MNHGYCRLSVKAMAVGVVTKPVPKKYLKLTLFQNISERNLKQTNFKQKLYQTVSEEASLTKKPIKRNLYQKQFQEKSPQPFFLQENWQIKTDDI